MRLSKLVCAKGTTLIEASLVLPVFFLILISGIDLLRVSYVAVSLQWATDQGARYASLGQTGTHCGVNHNQLCSSREEAIRAYIEQKSRLNIAQSQFNICPAQPTSASCTAGIHSAGGNNSWVYLSVTHPVTLILGGIQIPLAASSLTKSEPHFK